MSIKYKRVYELYDGFKGYHTFNTIYNQIPNELKKQLTSKQIAIIMKCINVSYHAKSKKNEVSLEDDCIWIGKDINKLIPLHKIKENLTKLTND